jgi:hypothetical protein
VARRDPQVGHGADDRPRSRTAADAWWRFGLAIAQTSLASAAAFALLRHADLTVVLLLTVAATALTGYSVRRWGGFWSRR